MPSPPFSFAAAAAAAATMALAASAPLASCTALPPAADVPKGSTSVGLPAPSRAIQLRAAFDKDPSVYIGRFIPDSVQPGDVDENNAAVTRCSKYIRAKTVDAQQEVDETMYVSRSASASLGLPNVAALNASRESRNEVRVKYSLTKKIQSEIDADGLGQCCKADPSQCTGRIIGEFLMGTGDVLQSAKSDDRAGTDLQLPKPVSGNVELKDDGSWKKKSSFKEVYFAFLPETTPTGLAATASAGDCSWCDTLPGSLDGKYFCGVSPEAPDEASGRTLAMRAAREQVVQYLGESISVASASTGSIVSKALEDREVKTAASQGVASQVKDEKWCKERVPTPDGEKVRVKVLALYPKSAEDAGKKAVAEAAIASQKKAGKMTAAEEKSVRAAAGGGSR
jgi:hypothetical protein